MLKLTTPICRFLTIDPNAALINVSAEYYEIRNKIEKLAQMAAKLINLQIFWEQQAIF
jgi:hypothetical protein